MQRRIRTAEDYAQRIQELRRRKALLLEKSHMLAQSVDGPDDANTNDDEEEKTNKSDEKEEKQSTAPEVAVPPSLASLRTAQGGSPVREGWAQANSSDSNTNGVYHYCGPTGITGVVSAVFPDGQLFHIVSADGT